MYYYDTYSDQERFLDNIPGPVISEYNIFYPSFGIIPIHDNWIMIIKADIEKRAGPTICTGFLENTDIKLYSFGESHCIIGDFPMLSYIKITNAQPAVNLYLNQEIFHPGDIMQVDAEVKNPRINTLNAVLHLYLIKKKVVHVKSVVIAVSLETILSITILEHQIQSKNTGNYAWLILLSNENGFLDYDLATFTFEKPD
ncbi:hypothetical protein CL633_01870 [bacterium]|nr:hypothetical protein [bacterium]